MVPWCCTMHAPRLMSCPVNISRKQARGSPVASNPTRTNLDKRFHPHRPRACITHNNVPRATCSTGDPVRCHCPLCPGSFHEGIPYLFRTKLTITRYWYIVQLRGRSGMAWLTMSFPSKVVRSSPTCPRSDSIVATAS